MRQPVPFGKYVLLERISVGGMAEVFKAKSFGVEGFEKIFAVKRILPSLAEDSVFIDMFIDEAKICGQLNHANICQIFELGRVGDSHFIAMEYIWGKDLLQIQNRFRKNRELMKPEMAAFIVAKLCEGLDYAHKKRDPNGNPLHIIHRDISPQNVLMSYEGEIKIIDFGIAKAASRSSQTQAGVLKGKFGYMSPEQVRGKALDRRSDVFAIGTILYELLTADRLFTGDSDFETLEKVRNVNVPPPSRVNPAIPAELDRIILKSLAAEIEERYQWAGEMHEDLQAFLMGFDPVYTAKQLATFMRTTFATEMRREQEILDEQRQIGREVLSTPPTPVAGQAPLDDSIIISEERFDGDVDQKTVVSENPPPPAEAPTAPIPLASPTSSSGEIAGQSTKILGEASPLNYAALAPPPSAPPSVGPPPSSAAPQPAPNASLNIRRPTPAAPSPGTAPAPALVPPGRPSGGHPQVTPPRRKSTLAKDITIGVLVASIAVAAWFAGRAYLTHRALGTLVVLSSPPRDADVLFDGVMLGRMEAGKPFKLRDLPSGPHNLVVRAADGAEFRQPVDLQSGDVTVVWAMMKAPKTPVAMGTLKLNLHTEGVSVYLNGAELQTDGWRNPLQLRAEVPHEVRITKPDREEVKFTVNLQPGQDLVKEIELFPAGGRLTVSTVPAGATVIIDGKTVGTTPTTLTGLDKQKPIRILFRLAGYSDLTRRLNFDHEVSQTLELPMTPLPGQKPIKPTPPHGNKPSSAENTKTAVLPPKAVVVKPPLPPPPKPPTPAPVETKVNKPAEPPKETAKSPPSDGGDYGFLLANTKPWAKVIIDGADTGLMTPIQLRSRVKLKAGKHVVTFVAAGREFRFDIEIKPGEETKLIRNLVESTP